MNGDIDRSQTIAGLALVGVGIVSTLGIITAEALYPGYSTAEQTISALGAATASGGAGPALGDHLQRRHDPLGTARWSLPTASTGCTTCAG